MRKERKKQKTITHQIAISLVGIVVLTVGLCWVFNTVFLGTYYRIHKQNELSQAYQKIDDVSKKGELETDDFAIEFERICSNGNIATIIMRPDHSTVVASSNMLTAKQFMDVFFGDVSGYQHLQILENTENYQIGRLKDKRMNEQYLILMGNLQDGNQILMRTALESIKESAAVSNQFLFFAGLISCGIGMIVITFISKKMTAPLLRLTELAQRMSNLDFNVRYEKKEGVNKEIDMLGDCMNSLSTTLETTISELKSANNELKIDIKKKNEIDQMRKEFLSNVSHELKTPLALIQGYAEGLQECVNDNEESRNFYCDVIIDEAGKMNRMVKKLLTLNQLEFGNEIVQMERFNLTELICGIIQATDILLQQNQITLTFGQKEQVVYAWADEFKVEEVITNYLSNAINHCEGEKRIDIKYTKKENCVRVSVFNTGKPIPEADLENIWEKFYKVDKARTRAYGGSGIGLSIVKAIMDSFHRECGVINHENGVEFWIELDTKTRE